MRISFRLAIVIWLAIVVASPASARKIPDDLPDKYRVWLEEVDLLLSKEELKAFLALEKDYQRDGFIARFWEARDPFPDTVRNEFRDAWTARLEYVRDTFGNLVEQRARIVLLNDLPHFVQPPPCSVLFWNLEIWEYQGSEQLRRDFKLIFYQYRDEGDWKLWFPFDGISDLIRRPDDYWGDCGKTLGQGLDVSPEGELECLRKFLAKRCPAEDAREFYAAVYTMVDGLDDPKFTIAKLERRPDPQHGEWLATFDTYSTDLPRDAPTFETDLEILFPGRKGFRTVVQGLFSIPVASVEPATLEGRSSYDFQLQGEVIRDGELFESFRYRFDLPASQVAGERLPLVFQRSLRPGTYTLVLKLEDLHGGKYSRHETAIDVPSLDHDVPAGPPADPRTAEIFAETQRALADREHPIRLVAPADDVNRGMVRFDTHTRDDVAKVTFYLDGRPLISKKRPPFSVELDLGEVPRRHVVGGVAFDGRDQLLGRDEIELNLGGRQLGVRLVEPERHQRYDRTAVVRVGLEVPEGQILDRVEIYLAEDRVATLYQEPFDQVLTLPEPGAMTYVRAVAYLEDGNYGEDTVFINAPDYLEEIDIQLVELFASVLDGQGRPVLDLGRDAFSVAEDGVAQEIVRFEQVRDLPIHVAILFDTSASMAESLDQALAAALGFFREIITPKDRAAIVTFNDRPNLVADLTNQVDSLAEHMAAIKAEGGTALWDSLVFTLYNFNGIKGQRAVLLLTDGRDEASRYSFDEALSYAQGSGVAVYAIGLALKLSEVEARRQLAKLADGTGGRRYLVDGPAELPAIYAQIQAELRSKYLVVYQSSKDQADYDFRTVDLKVARPGLTVKTIQGYYP